MGTNKITEQKRKSLSNSSKIKNNMKETEEYTEETEKPIKDRELSKFETALNEFNKKNQEKFIDEANILAREEKEFLKTVHVSNAIDVFTNSPDRENMIDLYTVLDFTKIRLAEIHKYRNSNLQITGSITNNANHILNNKIIMSDIL